MVTRVHSVDVKERSRHNAHCTLVIYYHSSTKQTNNKNIYVVVCTNVDMIHMENHPETIILAFSFYATWFLSSFCPLCIVFYKF